MLVQAFFKFRPLLLNGLFIAYLWFGEPLLLARLNAALGGRGNWWLGALLLVIPLLEIFGMVLKRPVSVYFACHYPNHSVSTWYVVVYLFSAMFHLSLAVFLVITAFQVGGGMPAGDLPGPWQGLMLGLTFLVLIKEAFFVVLAYPSAPRSSKAYSLLSAFNLPPSAFSRCVLRLTTVRRLDSITLQDALLDLLGELLLLVFAAVVYTTMWTSFSQGNSINSGPEGLTELVGMTIFFCMVFIPLRMATIMDEMAIQLSQRQREISWASLALTWVAAMIHLSS